MNRAKCTVVAHEPAAQLRRLDRRCRDPRPATREQLRSIYDDDLEKVDLTVGMLGESLPRGFGFSDTAFRIFILMASRRLMNDRFYTVDLRPEVYTPEGMGWLDDNTMSTVLMRHYPELEPALRGVRNAFARWTSTAW